MDAHAPTDTELVLLSLDHLRELRRTERHGGAIRNDYLTIACWALQRAVIDLPQTDPHPGAVEPILTNFKKLPSVASMEQEVLLLQQEEHKTDNAAITEDEDAHNSQAHRYFVNEGLASDVPPLTLPEIVAAGLVGLGARSRLAAEKEMIGTDLFQQFLTAVSQKGFFDEGSYEERFRKVVAKFRSKLASKQQGTAELVATAAAANENQAPNADYVARTQFFSRILNPESPSVVSSNVAPNPVDLREAERLKSVGNVHMQNKEYEQAATAYTQALKLSPDGPNSHVYYSNRAAALVSRKQFHEAIRDSERALALQPEYAKAHARLGLAHFLLGHYRNSMEAYTVALKYEPDNASSKSYLEKAAQRLAAATQSSSTTSNEEPTSSFSIVSEWEKSKPNDTAEKFKVKGNVHMANRDYSAALEAYSKAIQISPHGPHAHVYYSNRAAAHCYLEEYVAAERDSLQSLALVPDYSKAHARLGLSRFFLENYQGAVIAYTNALKLDPNNAASKSYLNKAQVKLKMQQQQQQ